MTRLDGYRSEAACLTLVGELMLAKDEVDEADRSTLAAKWEYLSIAHVNSCNISCFECITNLTYLPHKAVAEVSKDKEPIGRECAEFNWFENELMSDSNELRVK